MTADFRPLARRAAGIATGQLGWTADAFWGATVVEFITALEGRLGGSPGTTPLGRGELERLRKGLLDG
jgi:hypothetical protein